MKMQYKIIGKCPMCGGAVYDYPRSYGCGNWKSGCTFTMWKDMYGLQIGKEDALKLLNSEILGPYEFETKEGTKFLAKIHLVGDSLRLLFDGDEGDLDELED